MNIRWLLIAATTMACSGSGTDEAQTSAGALNQKNHPGGVPSAHSDAGEPEHQGDSADKDDDDDGAAGAGNEAGEADNDDDGAGGADGDDRHDGDDGHEHDD